MLRNGLRRVRYEIRISLQYLWRFCDGVQRRRSSNRVGVRDKSRHKHRLCIARNRLVVQRNSVLEWLRWLCTGNHHPHLARRVGVEVLYGGRASSRNNVVDCRSRPDNVEAPAVFEDQRAAVSIASGVGLVRIGPGQRISWSVQHVDCLRLIAVDTCAPGLFSRFETSMAETPIVSQRLRLTPIIRPDVARAVPVGATVSTALTRRTLLNDVGIVESLVSQPSKPNTCAAGVPPALNKSVAIDASPDTFPTTYEFAAVVVPGVADTRFKRTFVGINID